MLENLDKVDWSKYSTQVDIAQLIKQLASTDKQIVVNAYDKMDHSLLFESTISAQGPALLYRVFETNMVSQICPFLIEILANKQLPHKAIIVHLLNASVELTDYVEFEDPQKTNAKNATLAVCEGFHIYVSTFSSELDEMTKLGLADLIGSCAFISCDYELNNSIVNEAMIFLLDELQQPHSQAVKIRLAINACYIVLECHYPDIMPDSFVPILSTIVEQSDNEELQEVYTRVRGRVQ